MKQKILKIIAFIFPWLILLYKEKPIAALIALALQLTLIGWIPAFLLAIKALNSDPINEDVSL